MNKLEADLFNNLKSFQMQSAAPALTDTVSDQLINTLNS